MIKIPTVQLEAAIMRWRDRLVLRHGIRNLNQIGNGFIDELVSEISTIFGDANEDVEGGEHHHAGVCKENQKDGDN